MIKLAHISDLHFGKISHGVVQKLLADLRSENPDYLLVSGDITQSAKREEFEDAAKFFEEAPGKTFVVPGNHDIPGFAIWNRLTRPYARYRRYISQDLNPVFHDENILIAGFNTARRVVYDINWSHGRISDAQMASLKPMAEAAGSVPKLAMFHHPLLPPPQGVPQRRVGRAEKFAASLSDAGFNLALSGHLHSGRITQVSEVYSGVDPKLHAVEAGTATSSRLRNKPNEYNLIEINGGKAAVRVRRFGEQSFSDDTAHEILL